MFSKLNFFGKRNSEGEGGSTDGDQSPPPQGGTPQSQISPLAGNTEPEPSPTVLPNEPPVVPHASARSTVKRRAFSSNTHNRTKPGLHEPSPGFAGGGLAPETEKILCVNSANQENCLAGSSITSPPSCPPDVGPRPSAASETNPEEDGGGQERAPPKGGSDPNPAQGCRAPDSGKHPLPNYAFELAEGEEELAT